MTAVAADPQPHTPVLRDRMLQFLAPRNGGVYIDATFGRGGYSATILAAADCELLAIDRDPAAEAVATEMQQTYGRRFHFERASFDQLPALAENHGIRQIDGIVFDLGVSSPQLDEGARGFSYHHEGPLDMRMDPSQPLTAAEIIASWPEADLIEMIRTRGEEKFAKRIARSIVKARQTQAIETTTDLATLIREVVPKTADSLRLDPATRTFQALRITVNNELDQLEQGLTASEQLLAPDGVLVVVSFHSLEDRTVKLFLHSRAGVGEAGGRRLPGEAEPPSPTFELLTTKPVTPNEAEIKANPRARSAKMRAAKRTNAAIPQKETVL